MVCEAVEVRIADFVLTDSGNGKILPRGGRLCDRSGRSEARRLHYDIDIKKEREVSLMVLTLEDRVREVTQSDQFSLHYRL